MPLIITLRLKSLPSMEVIILKVFFIHAPSTVEERPNFWNKLASSTSDNNLKLFLEILMNTLFPKKNGENPLGLLS